MATASALPLGSPNTPWKFVNTKNIYSN
jgi:hypothetical protein